MGSIDKNFFNSLILFSRKNDFVDKSLTNRVFEPVPHSISDIEDVKFTSYSAEDSIKKVNILPENTINSSVSPFLDVYFVTVSSFIYVNLLNEVKIPTLNFDGEKANYIKCILSINDCTSDFFNKNILAFLSFLNLPINEPIIISDEIHNFIASVFDQKVISNILCEFTLNTKKIVLDTLESDYQMLSSVNQMNYRQTINTILNYRTQQLDSKLDNTRMDSLQAYLIEQQLRFKLYKVFSPIFKKNPVKFRTMESFHDFNGNLFFYIEYPQVPTEELYSFGQISEYVISNGFFISYINANDKTVFQKSIENTSEVKIETSIPTSDTSPNIYPLLFRLCDSELPDFEDEINNLIADYRYDELFLCIEKILTS